VTDSTEPKAGVDGGQRELKTCEWCGRIFVRIMPLSAREGQKICGPCKETPPTEEEESRVISRTYQLHGVKIH
jgi:hypothetical protein